MTYICGDLHGSYNNATEEKFLKGLNEDDILIVLGDFGWTWNPSFVEKFSLPCITLFIDGNHENFDILDNLEEKEMYGSKVGVLKDRVYHLKRGNMYTINDKKYFAFGGSASIDKGHRLPYLSWWPHEVPNGEEFDHAMETLKENDYKFDYLLSHTASYETVIEMMRYPTRFNDPTEVMLSEIEEAIDANGGSYEHNFFGHHHVYGHNDKHTAMYCQVYCVETGKTLFF